jgi:predicted transcriptional regulator
MADEKAATRGSNVVPLRPQERNESFEKKWGKLVLKQGFCLIPSLLLRAAKERLGLSARHQMVLLQLCDYWWDHDRKPYPSRETIGARLGLGPRQVQRYMADLEKAGLVSRNARYARNRGRLSNEYDLSGLVERLKKIAPELEQAKALKRHAIKRGGLKAAAMRQESEEA